MVEISESLFAHIHNDPFLTGTYNLEGQRHETTVGFLNDYISSLPDNSLTPAVLKLQEVCNEMLEYEQDISNARHSAHPHQHAENLAAKWHQKIKELKSNEYTLFPGGWTDNSGGHAMVNMVTKEENGDLLFIINNSGAGIQYHPKISDKNKELYSPTLKYRIPADKVGDANSWSSFFTLLIDAMTGATNLEGNVTKLDEDYLYKIVYPKLAHMGGQLEEISELEKLELLTAGQLSGTCAQRSIHQMLKSKFNSVDEYRQFIYGFKTYALKLYIEKLKKDGNFSSPKYQSQVIKAIHHDLRLLNLKQSQDSTKDLFMADFKQSEMDNLTAYLREMREARIPTPVAAKSPEVDRSTTEFTITTRSKTISDHNNKIGFSPVQTGELLDRPQGGKNLLQEMTMLKDWCARMQMNSKYDIAFEGLEQFFLTIPLDNKSFYKGIDRDNLQKFFTTMTDLQKQYFEVAKQVVGVDGLLPSMILVKASAAVAMGNVAENAGGLVANLHNQVSPLLKGLTISNRDNVYLANQRPQLDSRLQEIMKIHDKQSSLHGAFPSDLEKGVLNHYMQLLDQYPEAKERLEVLYDQSFGEDSSNFHKFIRESGARGLYYFLKSKHNLLSPAHVFADLLKEYNLYTTMEFAYKHGLLSLNGENESHESEEPGFSYDSEKNKLQFHSVSTSNRSYYFWQHTKVSTMQYVLPESSVKKVLQYWDNQDCAWNSTSIGPRNSIRTQIYPISTLDEKYKHNKLSVEQRMTVNDREDRELFHLRHIPKHQVILTLEYFLKHPEKLTRPEMQVYLEANLFQTGLLLNHLNSRNSNSFWELFDRFIKEGLEHSNLKGELSEQSVFYIRLSQMVNQYAFRADTDNKARWKKFNEQFDTWFKLTSNVNLKQSLHQLRFDSIISSLESRRLKDDEIEKAMESYFIIQSSASEKKKLGTHVLHQREKNKSLFVRLLNQDGFILPVKTIQSLLIKNGFFEDSNELRVTSEFPILSLKNVNTGDNWQVHILKGKIYKNNMAFSQIPLEIRSSPLFTILGLDTTKQCYVSSDGEQFIMELPKTRVRFTKNGKVFDVEQEFVNSKAQVKWFNLQAFSQSQATALNISMDIDWDQLPQKYKERDMLAWVDSENQNEILISQHNIPRYIANRMSNYTNNWELVDLQQKGTVLNNASIINKLLEQIESPDFQHVCKVDGGYSATLTRYGIEFFKADDEAQLYLLQHGKRYPVDTHNDLNKAGIAALTCADHSMCVLPIAQFKYKDQRSDNNEFYVLAQDLKNEIAEDITLREPKYMSPKVWRYSDSRNALILKMKDGEPVPENTAQALYLCYIYLGSHQPEKAWKILEDCEKKLGGLKGTADEVRYIRWICEALPYIETNSVKEDKAKLSTPSEVACQLKAISLLTEYSKRQKTIKFPALVEPSNNVDEHVNNEQIKLDADFYNAGVNSRLYTLYQRYQVMRRDLPSLYVLNDYECRSLLNYYHRLSGGSATEQKAIGALGYDWVRLNLSNLKKEMDLLESKLLSQRLSQHDTKRLQELKTYLENHTGVAKKRSVLEYRALNLSLKNHAGFAAYPHAKQVFLDVFYPQVGVSTESSLLTKADSAMAALTMDMDSVTFNENFPAYLKIMLTLRHPQRNALIDFCTATLIASRHIPLKEQKSSIPYLCNLLYRISCQSSIELRSIELSKRFTNIDNFMTWAHNLACDKEIKIPQLLDDTSELLASAEDVWLSIPAAPIYKSPEISSSLAKEIKEQKLFDESDLELDEIRDEWEILDKLFQRPKLNEVNDEKIAGDIKYNALLAMKELALKAFSDRNKCEILQRRIEERITFYADKQANLELLLNELANSGPDDPLENQRWKLDRVSDKKAELDIKRLLSLYMKADLGLYKQETGLSEQKINELHGRLALYLKTGSQLQQVQRVSKRLEAVLKDDKASAEEFYHLAKGVFEQNRVDVIVEPALGVFQYLEGILLREQQKDAVGRLLTIGLNGKYQEIVEKIIMGGGKSKVVLPLMAYFKASGDNLVIIEVPRPLLHTNYVDLKATSNDLFGQSAILFEFTRDTDSSSNALRQLYQNLHDAMINKQYLVTTGEDIQSVQLKYLELLASKPVFDPDDQYQSSKNLIEWEKQVEWADKLVQLILNRGDCLIDEVHHGLLLKNKLNYTIGDSQIVSKEIRTQMVALYRFLKEIPLNQLQGFEQSTLSMSDLLRRKKPLSTKEQYNEVGKLLGKALIENPASPLRIKMKALGLGQLSTNNIEELQQYLLNKGEQIPQAVLNYPAELKELFGLFKEQVNHVMPYALKRNCGEHYGPSLSVSKNPQVRALAIPYFANNTPNEGSEFGNVLEYLDYTIQSVIINGVSKPLLIEYLKLLLEQARIEMQEKQFKSLNETVHGSLYNTITGASLDDLDLDNQDLVASLHQRLAHKDLLIDEVLKSSILPNIRFNPKVLSSNALNHVDMYYSVQAMSGTPSNFTTYHERLRFEREASFGSDEYILSSLEGKNTPVIAIDFDNPETMVERLLSRYQATDQLKSIIDVCAGFKGISNFSVAQQIVAAINKSPDRFATPEPLKFVLFFNDNNELSALPIRENVSASEVITIGSSDPDVINERLGCSHDARFTYYDQAHTVGADIKQSDEAKALVLCDQDTYLSWFLQGALREREVVEGKQTIDVIVPLEMEGISFRNLTNKMKEQEQVMLRRDNFEAASARMVNKIRTNLLKHILNIQGQESADKKAILLDLFKHYFIEEQEQDFFVLYGGLDTMKPTKDLLEAQAKNLQSDWKKLLQEAQIQANPLEADAIEKSFAAIVTEASKPGVCEPLQPSKGLQAKAGMEVHRETKVEKVTEKHSQNEFYKKDIEPTDYKGWSSYFYTGNNKSLGFLNLNEICQSTISDQKNIPQFNPSIRASTNFYKLYKTQGRYLNQFAESVHELYFCMENDQLICTILSPEEAAEIGSRLASGYINGWISTTLHQVTEGNPIKDFKSNPEYQNIIEQVRFFNGELNLLLERDVSLTWLNDHPKDKLEFFENYLAPQREYNAGALEQLRNLFLSKNRMIQLIAKTPDNDWRTFNWKANFPEADETEINEVKQVALAFYDLTGLWWNDDVDLDEFQSNYRISPIAVAYLSQYYNRMKSDLNLLQLRQRLVYVESLLLSAGETQSLVDLLTDLSSGTESTDKLYDKYLSRANELSLTGLEWEMSSVVRVFYQQKGPWIEQNIERSLVWLIATNPHSSEELLRGVVLYCAKAPEVAIYILFNSNRKLVRPYYSKMLEYIRESGDVKIWYQLVESNNLDEELIPDLFASIAQLESEPDREALFVALMEKYPSKETLKLVFLHSQNHTTIKKVLDTKEMFDLDSSVFVQKMNEFEFNIDAIEILCGSKGAFCDKTFYQTLLQQQNINHYSLVTLLDAHQDEPTFDLAPLMRRAEQLDCWDLLFTKALNLHTTFSLPVLSELIGTNQLTEYQSKHLFDLQLQFSATDIEVFQQLLLQSGRISFLEDLMSRDLWASTSTAVVRKLALKSEWTTEGLLRLVRHPEIETSSLEYLLSNISVPIEVVQAVLAIRPKERLSNDVLRILATLSETSSDELAEIAERSDDPDVLIAVADNRKTPSHVLNKLLLGSDDEDLLLILVARLKGSIALMTEFLKRSNLSANLIAKAITPILNVEQLQSIFAQKNLKESHLVRIVEDSRYVEVLAAVLDSKLPIAHTSLVLNSMIGNRRFNLSLALQIANENELDITSINELIYQFGEHHELLEALILREDAKENIGLILRSNTNATYVLKEQLPGFLKEIRPVKVLHHLVSMDDLPLKLRVLAVQHDHADLEVLGAFIQQLTDNMHFDLAVLYKHPYFNALDEETLFNLLTKQFPDKKLSLALLKHPKISSRIVEHIVSETLDAKLIIGILTDCPRRLISTETYKQLAINPLSSHIALTKILEQCDDIDVQLAVANNPNYSAEGLKLILSNIKSKAGLVEFVQGKSLLRNDEFEAILMRAKGLGCTPQVLTVLLDRMSSGQYAALVELPLFKSLLEDQIILANRVMRRLAVDASQDRDFDRVINVMKETKLSETVYESLLLNTRIQAQHVQSLQAIDLQMFPAQKYHVDCYMANEKMKVHLTNLSNYCSKLSQKPNINQNHKTAIQAVTNLRSELVRLNDELIQSNGLINKDKVKRFQDGCVKAIEKYAPTIKEHHHTWYRIHPFLRGILGVLSILPLGIPAIIVAAQSKHGFGMTFFGTPKKKIETNLEDIKQDALATGA